jgi:hypothetical protein
MNKNEVETDRQRVKKLLNSWDTHNEAAKFRNELRKMAWTAGLDNIGDFIESLFSTPEAVDDGVRPGNIHDLAKRMITDGFTGQGMKEQDKASDYILLAANNPRVEDELPPAGFAFWKAAKFKYDVFIARRNQGRATE